MRSPLATVIVGCGNVAPAYAETIKRSSRLRFVGACSRTPARAEQLAEQYGCKCFRTLEEVLADPDVELVVNLTTQDAHAEITRQCIHAGKHVYSEKPLALSASEAISLVELAESAGVYLGAAPSTFLAPPQQQAIRIVRSGRLGIIRGVYAEANWGRIETWHPTPEPFYAVGPLADVGVYPITLLTAALGKVTEVRAFDRMLLSERHAQDRRAFAAIASDFTVALLEFEVGCVARLTANFYVHPGATRQRGIEFHGDVASLTLSSWFEGNGQLALVDYGTDAVELREPEGCFAGVDYGLGLEDLAAAVSGETEDQQASGVRAAHVASVVEAITLSASSGGDPFPVRAALM